MAATKQVWPKITPELMEGFVASCLVKDYDNATRVPQFHRELWELFCADHPNVAVAAPRRHAKTTAGTQAFTLANILFRQRRYCLIVSDTETQAEQFLGEIKNTLAENEDIHGMFGHVKFIKDNATDFIAEFEDGWQFRIQAKGAEQKLRGLKWNSLRPDLICIDDLENDELVLNQDRREKLKRWFYGALLPCRSKTGIVRYVGTILHMDSLLENLIRENMPRYDRYRIQDDLRIISTQKVASWLVAKYKAHNADFTATLWPENYDGEYFLKLRDDFVKQGLPDVYSQEYLNVPIDPSVAMYRKDDFIAMTEKDHERHKKYYIACDLAISEKQRSDYTVFVVAGVDERGVLHIVDVIRERVDSRGIVDNIISLQRRYRPEIFAIEQGHIQKSIGPFLREEMLSSGVFVNLMPIQPSTDKVTRARSMNARFRSGSVRVDTRATWYLDYEDEMLTFPRSRHDDQVDATSYIGLCLDQLIPAETEEELEEEEWYDEHGADFDSPVKQGANYICGY